MENEELVTKDVWYPWTPMSKPIDIKHLGKMGEELCEAGAITFRSIIQGIDECEPVTGKLNREKLEDEIADVEANIELVKVHFNLDVKRMGLRKRKKKALLKKWHNDLQEQPDLQNLINMSMQHQSIIPINDSTYFPIFSICGITTLVIFILYFFYRNHL